MENKQTKKSNMYLIGNPEGVKRENEAEVICKESVAENFPELMKYIHLQIQKPNKY